MLRLLDILKEEADIPLSILKDETRIEEYLTKQIVRAIKTYRLNIPKDSVKKFIYYIKITPSEYAYPAKK